MRYLTALVSAACLVVLVPVESRAQGFTAGVKGGLNVSTLDVDDPANPDGEGSYDTPWLAMGVAVAGDYAYVADWSGLQVVDGA